VFSKSPRSEATLTTLYLQFEKEVEAALGLPPGVHSYALLPIGYPMGRCAVSLLPMSSMKIVGASLTAICSGPNFSESRSGESG
jgi:hypothetical protein